MRIAAGLWCLFPAESAFGCGRGAQGDDYRTFLDALALVAERGYISFLVTSICSR